MPSILNHIVAAIIMNHDSGRDWAENLIFQNSPISSENIF